MINVDTKQTLSIILPNTNKALEEVIKKATPKELQTLTQGKDLKSLVNNLLKQSLDVPSQNKTLLNLVKNNPTFKELGSTTTSVKELLALLTQDKTPLPLESTLKKLLNSLKPVSETPKLQDSKILQEFSKAVQNVDVRNLKPSILADVKALVEKVKISPNPALQETKAIYWLLLLKTRVVFLF